jgi:hypothetical protein
MSISVVYIARGRDAGLASTKRFFDWYKEKSPGCENQLYVVTKGWDGVQGLSDVKALASQFGAFIVDLPDDGYDWGAYMRVAPELSGKWLCLLNSHSYPLVQGWLSMLHSIAIEHPMVGACGATGSWGTWYFRLPFVEHQFNSLMLYPARVARALIDHVRRIGEVTPFPNPHLRSNGIFIKRELFLQYCTLQPVPRNKRDSHLLEGGKYGLSNFLLEKGFGIKVVGANGASYDPESWIDSKTFRVPTQSNLLISDNQTRAYEHANHDRKRRLEYASWGKIFTPKYR